MTRVGIISLIHESNGFIKTPTTLEMFQRDRLVSGQEMYEMCASELGEVNGFLSGLDDAGIEPVPIFFARTPPSGAITSETCDSLMELMFSRLAEAGQLDGILANPHGANMGEGDEYRDLDGHWLTRLRQTVGAETPIICTIDPHCNLSARMINACDATIAYRTNPHLDQRERGIEAAGMMARTLAGEIKPVQAAAFPPIAINIERQRTETEPCRSLYQLADEMLEGPEVLSNSIVLGFPYADVEEMGSALITVTDNDPRLAAELSNQLSAHLYVHRCDYAGQFITIEEAIDEALQLDPPVCLLDMGDNIGGGSTADGTLLAHAMHNRGGIRGYVCLFDQESVRETESAGVGNKVSLKMGGKIDDQHGPPLEAEVTVLSLHEGKFRESEVRHGGRTEFDMGRTALVETENGLTIQLTSNSCAPISLGLMTSCGLRPDSFQIVVAKGVQSPVPAFDPVCTALIRVDTPGSTRADMRQLHYDHRRKPLFPFEEI